MRFQPSIDTSCQMTRGVIARRSLGCTSTATRAPLRRPLFTSSSTEPSGCTASMKPPIAVFQAVTRAAAAPPRGTLRATLVLLPKPPAESASKPSSPVPSSTPSSGWFVM